MRVFFVLSFILNLSIASSCFAQLKWQDVATKEDLKIFSGHSNESLSPSSAKQKSFKDIVNDIRNRPAIRAPKTYVEGRDWRGLNNNGGWSGHGWGGSGGWGHGWGWGRYHHASTAAQGFLDGVANVLTAKGRLAESLARSRTQNAEARRREILNDSMYIQQWFERRKMNKEYVAAERDPTPTKEQLERLAKIGVPSRLINQLDRVNGKIFWLEVFDLEMFAEHRIVMDKLFKIRCNREVATGLGTENSRWMKIVGDEMLEILKKNSSSFAPEEYLVSKKFLEGLVYESRFPIMNQE